MGEFEVEALPMLSQHDPVKPSVLLKAAEFDQAETPLVHGNRATQITHRTRNSNMDDH
jgi:hypothetical protein